MPNSQTETQTFRLERTFDCTPEELWAAWTERDQFAKWISPFGRDAEVPRFDARTGGKIEFVMIDENGHRFPTEHGEFEEMDPPNRLVLYQSNEGRNDIFAGFPMRMTVTFEAVGDKTRMNFLHEGYPPKFPIEEARKGFTACFDKLQSIVESHA